MLTINFIKKVTPKRVFYIRYYSNTYTTSFIAEPTMSSNDCNREVCGDNDIAQDSPDVPIERPYPRDLETDTCPVKRSPTEYVVDDERLESIPVHLRKEHAREHM